MSKLKFILAIMMLYISVAGLVTFSLFIHEEAIQTAMFGTWPAKDINRWDLVMDGANLMGKINTSAKIINYTVGWIQPLAFFSYRAYSKATDFYIESIEAEAFAHDPKLFIGRNVEFKFYPKKLEETGDGRWMAVNGKLVVIFDKQPALGAMRVEGKLIKYKNYLAVVK